MKAMQILIVDDEPIARDILRDYVARMPQLGQVAVCRNAGEATKALEEHTVDLVLLDINMPGLSGIELVRSLPNPPLVILTTAYSQYAVESYELDAVDYLLKPFSFDRFEKAINKAATMLQNKKADENIFVKCDGKLVQIDINSLELVEAVRDYVKLHTNDKTLLTLSTMKNMEEQLSDYPQMVRVHKSFIVNIAHVRELSGNLIYTRTRAVPIGNTYKEMVAEVFNKHRLV